MFCNACGKELPIGQQVCSACGQPVGVAPIPRSINRVSHHIQLLGVLWMAYSVLYLFGSIVLFALAATVFAPMTHMPDVPRPVPEFMHTLFVALGGFLLVKAALGIAA